MTVEIAKCYHSTYEKRFDGATSTVMNFSEARVSQMAAYLLNEGGGRMPYIKLLKLLYLTERKAVVKWGESISGDNFVSMPMGPVLSRTYDLIKEHDDGEARSPWHRLIRDEANYEVSLAVEQPSRDDFDELSDSELELLHAVYAEFGGGGRYDLVDYTHEYCAEWEDPNGSAFPIKLESVIRAQEADEERVQSLLALNRELTELRRTKQDLA